MSYYELPILPFIPNLHKYICVTFCSQDDAVPIISTSIHKYLNDVKKCIDSKPDECDQYKKYTNPYEYIHTSVPGQKTSVCRLKPLSRSFFKMIETSRVMNLLDGFGSKIKTFHLAEGPGGFMEAINYLRNNKSY